MEKEKRTKFFLEDEVSLPLEALLMEEMSTPSYLNRFRESGKARSAQYACGFFYKHISRPLPLDIRESGDAFDNNEAPE
ncbi:MAG TPA: hypothetical protein VKJ45_13875 [Blastocatellia bacterium]|nr:hypothetical protein [Blastocatellia bacterium]